VWCGLTRCHRLPLSLARRSSCRSPRAGPPRRSRGVASSILHKWEGFGWCSGVITKANDDLRRSIGGDKVNLFAHYEIDGEDENDVPHVLYTCSSSTSTGRRTTPSEYDSWSRSSHPEERRWAVRWRPARQRSRRQKRWRWTPHSEPSNTDTSAHPPRWPAGQRGPRCASRCPHGFTVYT
jgi:hypothetical protein